MSYTGLSTRHARAFTLIELVVVLIILGVVSGIIAPRLLSGSSRAAEADVRKVAELVSAAGRRDTMTSQQIAIDYDGTEFSLLVLRMPTAADAARGIPPTWVRDQLSMPVQLQDAVLSSVSIDGAELDPSRFRIEFLQRGQRPSVVMLFGQTRGPATWTVSLSTGSFRANVFGGEDRDAAMDVTSIDLDLAGKGEEPW
jgi:prepilin-type N-terminal cleavage/methylation domain-containing protein